MYHMTNKHLKYRERERKTRTHKMYWTEWWTDMNAYGPIIRHNKNDCSAIRFNFYILSMARKWRVIALELLRGEGKQLTQQPIQLYCTNISSKFYEKSQTITHRPNWRLVGTVFCSSKQIKIWTAFDHYAINCTLNPSSHKNKTIKNKWISDCQILVHRQYLNVCLMFIFAIHQSIWKSFIWNWNCNIVRSLQ